MSSTRADLSRGGGCDRGGGQSDPGGLNQGVAMSVGLDVVRGFLRREEIL